MYKIVHINLLCMCRDNTTLGKIISKLPDIKNPLDQLAKWNMRKLNVVAISTDIIHEQKSFELVGKEVRMQIAEIQKSFYK